MFAFEYRLHTLSSVKRTTRKGARSEDKGGREIDEKLQYKFIENIRTSAFYMLYKGLVVY